MYLNQSQSPLALGDTGLGNFFDDLQAFAAKIAVISGQASRIKEGDAKLAVVPTSGASVTFPVPGQPFGVTVPILPLAIGAGLLLFLAFRRK